MTERARRAIGWIAIVLVVLATILGFIVLPDTLVMQMTGDGEVGNTLPKALGLLVPLAIVAIFAFRLMRRSDGADWKDIVGICVGVAAQALLFVFNLR